MQNNTFSGLFVGQKIVTLQRVDSTNNYLKEELSKSKPVSEGTVILAEEQFAGRGQQNNAWVTEPGKNLTFSILLNPTFPTPEKQFMLNKAISLAINDILCKVIGNQVKIKWPNDIYYNDLKLGGILIENIIQGVRWKHAIIGVGLNVNQTSFPDYLNNVTSVAKILQHNYDLQSLLKDICKAIEVRYFQLKNQEFDILNSDYLNKLYRLGEVHLFEIEGERTPGSITGIGEQGFLQVSLPEGSRSFGFKEIAFVIP